MKRLGNCRGWLLQPPEPVVRYERATPGELLHLTPRARPHRRRGHRITGDRTLNRNRGIGWDMVHPAIDDHSRVILRPHQDR